MLLLFVLLCSALFWRSAARSLSLFATPPVFGQNKNKNKLAEFV